MPWPQPQDYNEAVQSPRLCFTDPDLKLGTPKLDARGLPVPISGAFASVYQITTPSGKWAVRCFVREVADSNKRYEEISKALSANRPTYTVPFEFQKEGIRVGGRRYPIVKMQWMAGELLGEYVAKNIRSPQLLNDLADKWASMISDLQARQLAHGDLQHGNVLVVGHEPKLIDYDGMYVPAFRGMRSNELGHPNFQHPQRTQGEFGPHIDNFAAWVIYVSLKTFAIAPDIHALVRGLGRDECLLFNREDYARPIGSPVFNQLRTHSNADVKKMAAHVAELLQKPLRDVPPLETSQLGLTTVQVQANRAQVPIHSHEWWRDHIPVAGDQIRQASPAPQVSVTAEFGPQPQAQREMLLLLLASMAALAAGLQGAIGIVGYGVVQIGLFIVAERRLKEHYAKCPIMAVRGRHQQEVVLKSDLIKEKTDIWYKARQNSAACEAEMYELEAKTQREIAALSSAQGGEIKQAYTDQAVALADLSRKVQKIRGDAELALRGVDAALVAEKREVEAKLSALSVRATTLLRSELDGLREREMRAFLSRHPISNASIPGVGPHFKATLRVRGIMTAADVSLAAVRVIPGFGYTRASSVVSWRDALAASYERRLSTKLSTNDHSRIQQMIEHERELLQRKLTEAESRAIQARRQIQNECRQKESQLPDSESNIRRLTEVRVAGLNSSYEQQIARVRHRCEVRIHELREFKARAEGSASNLERDIQRLQEWQRNIGIPTGRAYDALTFTRFLKTVFLSDFLK